MDRSRNAYRRAHDRVRAERGRATEYACVDCGDAAEEWSLKAETIAVPEVTEYDGRAYYWSPLPVDYEPRCVIDHRAEDARRAREERALVDDVLAPSPYADMEGLA